MKKTGVFNELLDKLSMKKSFRIHLTEKPETEAEVIFEIDNYQCERDEKYDFFKEGRDLFMKRDEKTYKVEVIEAHRTLLYPQPKLGTIGGTWVIEVTEVN